MRIIDCVYDDSDHLIEGHISDLLLSKHTITYTYDPVNNRLEKPDNSASSYTYTNKAAPPTLTTTTALS